MHGHSNLLSVWVSCCLCLRLAGAARLLPLWGVVLCTAGLQAAPVVTTQPSNVTVIAGQDAMFTVVASGTPTPTYQWEVSSDGGAGWQGLANSAPYSGVTTATLTASHATAAMSRYRFRCGVSSGSLLASDAALLRVAPASVNFRGSDEFATPALWSAPTMPGGATPSLGFTNNRLEYTAGPPTGDDAVLREWTPNVGSYTQDWAAQVDVHLDSLVLANGPYANLNLMVVNADDATNPMAQMDRMAVAIDRYGNGSTTLHNFESRLAAYYAGAAHDTGLVEVSNSTTDAALRISFNSATKELTSAYDANGTVGGYTWTPLQTINIGSGTYNWDMTAGSTFALVLVGGSGGVTLSPGQAYFDNFQTGSEFLALENWRLQYFGDPANSGIGENAADPDHDTINNLGEFALDADPTSGAKSGKLSGKIATVGGNKALTLTLPVRAGAILDPTDPAGGELVLLQSTEALCYQIQASAQLSAWTPDVTEVTGADATAIQAGLPTLHSGWAYRTFRAPDNIAGARVQFIRVGTGAATAESFALIPAGSFEMGQAGIANATPYQVYVSGFYMGRTEVTWLEWRTVRDWAVTHGYTDLSGRGAGKADNHPVHGIYWHEMVKWCNARTEYENATKGTSLTPCYYTDAAQMLVFRTGTNSIDNTMVKWSANGYRLPTEAEWEKAARGGQSGKLFPWGDTIAHSQANYCVYSSDGTTNYYPYDVTPRPVDPINLYYHPGYNDGAQPYTSPVGMFAANGYGLYDMTGNVWEGCWDWFLSNYYTTSPGSDPRGPATGSLRVRRGGCWGGSTVNYANYCRTANRNANSPTTYSSFDLGFRLARSSAP